MAGTVKRARETDDEPKVLHTCQLCNKSYERADHLGRHLDSHRNERTFKCAECPRGFNRRDLLLRHQVTHSKNTAEGRVGPNRANERAIKACDQCVLSKLKCDNARPCQRCCKRSIECRSDSLTQTGSSSSPGRTPNAEQFLLSPPAIEECGSRPDADISQHSRRVGQCIQPSGFDGGDLQGGMDLPQMSTFPPSFFDQIMVSDFVASASATMLPDVFNMMPETDWLSDTTDIFGLDFTPIIDSALEVQNSDFPFAVPQHDNVLLDWSAGNRTLEDSARQRHAIFQRSPWLWRPEANQNAFSEHNSIPLDEQKVDLAASPHQRFMQSLVLQDTLSQKSRDRIFQLVVRTAKSHVSIPSFPSAKCLGTLLKVGIAKRMETDAWIHPYSFDSEHTRTELLIALIAAGCVCFGIPSVSKTGLVLFEIARVALNRLVEDDNSVVRDLQYLQACMLWIDMTAFSGFKRKMEIAEGNLQPLVTALRRAGKFDRVAYSQVVPCSADDNNELEKKWRRWVDEESYKRLVHHLFEHDIYTTKTKVRSPLISYAEMSLPLPMSRDLWLAPNPEVWQLSFAVEQTPPMEVPLALRDLLANGELLRCLPDDVDEGVARTAHVCGLAAQTWEHFQQSSVVNSPHALNEDPSAKLWVQSRHQRLQEMLESATKGLQDFPAVTALFAEFVMMSIHVNPDDVTRFAGKCGEAEAHRAYQLLEPWSQTKKARLAIWHAGQVVRLASEVPPYQLRGADTLLTYHAIMVLWTYSMIRARRGDSGQRKTATSEAALSKTNSAVVMLNGPASARVEAFLLKGCGRPGLTLRSNNRSSLGSEEAAQDARYELQDPQAVMAVGVRILEESCPNERRENLPQLIRSLCILMQEFGSLGNR